MLVRGREATLLIDPSLSVAARAPELGRVDLMVQSHVHKDHVAGFFRFPDAAVYAHRDDVLGLHSRAGFLTIYGADGAYAAQMAKWVESSFNYRPRRDAQAFADGATFDLGDVRVRAIHPPGHMRGHCALLIEPADAFFLGDIDLTGFGPYYGDAWG